VGNHTSGYKGATLKHPGWKNGEVEWEPFPVDQVTRADGVL